LTFKPAIGSYGKAKRLILLDFSINPA